MLGLEVDQELTACIEMKKNFHKQAEQRRRDSLKQCFEELKTVLPRFSEKNPSKLYLLKKCMFDFLSSWSSHSYLLYRLLEYLAGSNTVYWISNH
jgi:hypothetical protein